MPAPIIDVSEFTDPIVRPTDGDPVNGASVLDAFQGLANRTRNLANRIGSGDGSTEWAYESGGAVRYKTVSVGGMEFGQDGSGNPLWRLALGSNVMHAFPMADEVFALRPIELPHLVTLQEIEVWVFTGASRLAADRWRISLWRQSMDDSGPFAEVLGVQQGATADDGGANGYTKVVLTHSLAIDRQNYLYHVRVQAPDSVSGDYLHAFRFRFDQPGPGPFGG